MTHTHDQARRLIYLKRVSRFRFVSGRDFIGWGKTLLATQILKGHDFSRAANATK